jgi:MFS superfamily sulfate permease-like transporter
MSSKKTICMIASIACISGVAINIASYQAHSFQARNKLQETQQTPHVYQWQEYANTVKKQATLLRMATPFAYILTSPKVPSKELEYRT